MASLLMIMALVKKRLDRLLSCEKREILVRLGGPATHSHDPAVSFSPYMAQPAGRWGDTVSHVQTYAVSN